MSLKHVARGLASAVILAGASWWVGATPPTDAALVKARQDLRISEAMAERIRARLRHVRQSPEATREELAELERYGLRLEGAVRDQRREVARLEALRPIDPRAKGAAAATAPRARSGFVTLPERTEADELEALDAELSTSLSRFDEMLLKERDRLRRSAGSTGAGDAAMSGMAGTSAEAPRQPAGERPEMIPERGGSGEPREQPTVGAPGLPRQPSGGASPKAGTAGTRSPIPPDIPDGSDDDLVARQIREAAMNEPDPTLREKLWEEYRKYKKGAG